MRTLTLNELPWFCEDQSAVSGLHRYYSEMVSAVQAAETLGSLGEQAMIPTGCDSMGSRHSRDGV